ncbi:MAG: hypothetical protein R3C61_27090 [Bacteroidia bacterium]
MKDRLPGRFPIRFMLLMVFYQTIGILPLAAQTPPKEPVRSTADSPTG